MVTLTFSIDQWFANRKPGVGGQAGEMWAKPESGGPGAGPCSGGQAPTPSQGFHHD